MSKLFISRFYFQKEHVCPLMNDFHTNNSTVVYKYTQELLALKKI